MEVGGKVPQVARSSIRPGDWIGLDWTSQLQRNFKKQHRVVFMGFPKKVWLGWLPFCVMQFSSFTLMNLVELIFRKRLKFRVFPLYQFWPIFRPKILTNEEEEYAQSLKGRGGIEHSNYYDESWTRMSSATDKMHLSMYTLHVDSRIPKSKI